MNLEKGPKTKSKTIKKDTEHLKKDIEKEKKTKEKEEEGKLQKKDEKIRQVIYLKKKNEMIYWIIFVIILILFSIYIIYYFTGTKSLQVESDTNNVTLPVVEN